MSQSDSHLMLSLTVCLKFQKVQMRNLEIKVHLLMQKNPHLLIYSGNVCHCSLIVVLSKVTCGLRLSTIYSECGAVEKFKQCKCPYYIVKILSFKNGSIIIFTLCFNLVLMGPSLKASL